MMAKAVETLTARCVRGITANAEHSRDLVEHSIGIVTALVPRLGYEKSGEAAKIALRTGRPVREIVLEQGWLEVAELDELLSAEAMTTPRPL